MIDPSTLDLTDADVEIQRTLCVQTSHITLSDAERLKVIHETRKGPVIVVANEEYFFSIFVSFQCWQEEYGDSSQAILDAFLEAGLSEALFDLCFLTDYLECDYLKLDCDGDTIDGYPVFDW